MCFYVHKSPLHIDQCKPILFLLSLELENSNKAHNLILLGLCLIYGHHGRARMKRKNSIVI